MIMSGAGALILATAARGGFTQPADAATIASLAHLDGLDALARRLRDAATPTAAHDADRKEQLWCSI